MKKLLALLLVLIMTLTLASCSFSLSDFGIGVGDGSTDNSQSSDDAHNKPKPGKTYQYNEFSAAEKKILLDYIGEVIPFIPNNEYALEGYYEETDYENGINFYTIGNTKTEFEAYRTALKGYNLVSVYDDEFGDTWYKYQKGSIILEISYYTYEGNDCIDIYLTVEKNNNNDNGSGDNSGNNSGNNSGTGSGSDKTYLYNDFTTAEKQLFTQYIGAIIPFMPNNEYYVEGYYDVDDYENGMCFYVVGVTAAEYDSYRAKYSGYTFDGSYVDDEYGDTWYCYTKGDVVVDMTRYEYEGEYYVEVYVYSSLSNDPENSGSGSGSGSTTDSDVITNKNKGLPPSSTGVYEIDFTDATYVKDVTDQGYFVDGCPTTGSPAVLVIPVDFTDAQASTRGYSTSVIAEAFKQGGEVDYYSVYDYYYISSYGQLTLDITVLDYWFRPSRSSTYYAALKDSDGYEIGDQAIIDEALAYLESRMDLSQFDSDGNGFIDSIVIINSLDISENTFNWAYRYWNYYADSDGDYYKYDGVSANDYLWASYQFIYEKIDETSDAYIYTDTTVRNTYTYIHEFAHILGAADYYDTAYVEHPMDGADMMDAMTGDHNAYTKFNYGWITSSRLVVADGSITLTLEAFEESGDTIIIANNFDPTLGVYQEYYVLMYYKNTGLNGGDDYGYFARDGILVYHVNASLFKEIYYGEVYYDVYNSNTDASSEDGTVDNLLEFVKSAADTYTYAVGDTLPTVTDDNGDTLCYTFTVDALTSDYATITFTKK